MERIVNTKNWYIVEIVERSERAASDKTNPNRRCTVWGNWHLIKAASLEEAYDKAEAIGKSGSYTFTNVDKEEIEWSFVGIGEILPIYEDIEDGAELLWDDYGAISAKRSERLVKSKAEWMALQMAETKLKKKS